MPADVLYTDQTHPAFASDSTNCEAYEYICRPCNVRTVISPEGGIINCDCTPINEDADQVDVYSWRFGVRTHLGTLATVNKERAHAR